MHWDFTNVITCCFCWGSWKLQTSKEEKENLIFQNKDCDRRINCLKMDFAREFSMLLFQQNSVFQTKQNAVFQKAAGSLHPSLSNRRSGTIRALSTSHDCTKWTPPFTLNVHLWSLLRPLLEGNPFTFNHFVLPRCDCSGFDVCESPPSWFVIAAFPASFSHL